MAENSVQQTGRELHFQENLFGCFQIRNIYYIEW